MTKSVTRSFFGFIGAKCGEGADSFDIGRGRLAEEFVKELQWSSPVSQG